jgi:hypothetical protein
MGYNKLEIELITNLDIYFYNNDGVLDLYFKLVEKWILISLTI